MNKSQYQRRTENLNPGISKENAEIKWRKHLKEKDEMENYRIFLEAKNTPAVSKSASGGGKSSTNTDFISVWRTTSTSESITLPLISAGIYNFSVDWGDGTSDNITLYTQSERTHIYEEAGDYIVTITGTLQGFNFSSVPTSRLNIVEIKQWGIFRFVGTFGISFFNCSNLTLENITDVPNLSSLAVFSGMFQSCSSLTTVGRMEEWDMSRATNISAMFRDATLFNQPLNSWNVSNLLSMMNIFRGATSFNQPLNSWNVSKVTNMSSAFQDATSFNQNISSWNIQSVTNLNLFMSGKSPANYSSANYDSLLISWNNLPNVPLINKNVIFGTIKYTAAAESARTSLQSKGWIISDGGIV